MHMAHGVEAKHHSHQLQQSQEEVHIEPPPVSTASLSPLGLNLFAAHPLPCCLHPRFPATATRICHHCRLDFCQECAELLHRSPLMQQHNVREIIYRRQSGALAHAIPQRLPRVLVVDDSSTCREMMVGLLGLLQCTVEAVDDGDVCVNKFAFLSARYSDAAQLHAAVALDPSLLPFDLILLDLDMPVMNGIEVTQDLRRRGFPMPIIIVTGGTKEEDQQACLRAGANQVLAKPVSFVQLRELLQQR